MANEQRWGEWELTHQPLEGHRFFPFLAWNQQWLNKLRWLEKNTTTEKQIKQPTLYRLKTILVQHCHDRVKHFKLLWAQLSREDSRKEKKQKPCTEKTLYFGDRVPGFDWQLWPQALTKLLTETQSGVDNMVPFQCCWTTTPVRDDASCSSAPSEGSHVGRLCSTGWDCLFWQRGSLFFWVQICQIPPRILPAHVWLSAANWKPALHWQ